MKIKTYDNGLTEILSEEDCILTYCYENNDRIFGEIFVLGKYDTVDNYEEWTLSEKKEWENAHPVEDSFNNEE